MNVRILSNKKPRSYAYKVERAWNLIKFMWKTSSDILYNINMHIVFARKEWR